MAVPKHLIDVKTIYLEPSVRSYARGQHILAQHPAAELIDVDSHWKIPTLHGNEGSAEDWLRIKRDVLVLGVKKGLSMRPNGRSAHFIAPSTSNGCAMACAYCYVPRRKGYANPISIFVNIDETCRAIARHAERQGRLAAPDQIDTECWVYDIGENGDLSVDATICDNVKDLVGLFRGLPNAKGSFATKFVNCDLLSYDPQGKTRLRFSLMPDSVAKVVDVRTSSIAERISAINEFVRAGYEVHLNFSPVIVYPGWERDRRLLFDQIDDSVSAVPRTSFAPRSSFLHTMPVTGGQHAVASQGRAVPLDARNTADEALGGRHVQPPLQGGLEAPMASPLSGAAGRSVALLPSAVRVLIQLSHPSPLIGRERTLRDRDSGPVEDMRASPP